MVKNTGQRLRDEGSGRGGRGGAGGGRGTSLAAQTPHFKRLDVEMRHIHAKTAALDRDNMTMKQKRDHDWKTFEKLGGGARPTPRHKFTEHLRRVTKRKGFDTVALRHERKTGEYDVVRGSVSEKIRAKAMDRRHGVEKKLKLQAKKTGNPHVLYRAGKMDFGSQTLNLSSKMPRKIERAVEHDRDVGDKKHRTDWRDDYNINRPKGGKMVMDCNDLNL